MNRWFADSFYFFALLNIRDENHERALAIANDVRTRIVTTEWVLIELADGFCQPDNRRMVASFIRDCRRSKTIDIIPADSGSFAKGLVLYESRGDKQWSLTDCISFLTMREQNIDEALTGDHHFEQAGFVALLK